MRMYVLFAAVVSLSFTDAKAAEAAQSAYYDPNRPQTAYVPPPYVSIVHYTSKNNIK